MSRKTLQDRLLSQKKEVPEWVQCLSCGRRCRPFEIVDVTDTPGIPHDDACSHCFLDVQREKRGNEDRQWRKSKEWSGPLGEQARAERNRLLDTWRWTLLPDSPLSDPCKLQFRRYLAKLHRITVDHQWPSQVIWPALPALEYAPADQQGAK